MYNQVLVRRDAKGHFIDVIKHTETKTRIDSSVWIYGYRKGKVRATHKMFSPADKRFQVIKETQVSILEEKQKVIYRCARGLSGVEADWSIDIRGIVPFHSTKHNPCYYGFTIYAYSSDSEYLNSLKEKLKSKLIALTEAYLHYNWSEMTDGWFGTYIGWEQPTRIIIDNSYGGTWEFLVEKKGHVEYEDSGELRNL